MVGGGHGRWAVQWAVPWAVPWAVQWALQLGRCSGRLAMGGGWWAIEGGSVVV